MRNVSGRRGINSSETSKVRWWILEQLTRLESLTTNTQEKLTLQIVASTLHLRAIPVHGRSLIWLSQRLGELGRTDYISTFGTF